MDRIIHELSQHAAVEEQVFYPIARRVLKDEDDLVAPSRPHPRAPDSPPANILLAPVAKAMDLAKDAIKGARRARELTAARRGSARARGRVARSTRR